MPGRFLRAWVWPILLGRTWRVALPVAAVVGSLLVALNQGSTIVGGHLGAVLLGRVLLNYLVPYVVSSVGYLRAVNARPTLAPK